MVLIFGIVGIAFCFIFGIVALVLGTKDLAAMRAGTMDPTGQRLTQAGQICGIIGIVLGIIGLGLFVGYWVQLSGAYA